MILQILNIDWSEFKKFTRFQNNNFSFSNILWSWQTWLSLDINYYKFDLIWKFAKFFVDERLVYSWVITDEKFNFIDKTTITIDWAFSLFNRMETTLMYDIHQATVLYVARIIQWRYTVFSFERDIQWTDYFTPPTTKTYRKWWAIIRDVVSDSKYDFFVWADTKVRFAEQISNKVHKLTVWSDWDIVWGFIWVNMDNYVSRSQIIDTWVSWTDTNYYTINEEDEAIYWRADDNIWSTSWTYSWTNTARTARNLLQSPEKITRLTIKKDIWRFEVWDYVTIVNSPVKVENVKIVRIMLL